jgi:capsule polysaccharide export protein KpsC/LpsZ
MFAWLDDLLGLIEAHRDTLFIVRAHPDEDRPGKASRQSVAEWAQERNLASRPNVFFFGPSDYVNSYGLIERSKFVLVYNSSIGLEATLLGVPVLCAGRARYTQWPTVTFPASREEYARLLAEWIGAPRLAFDESQRVYARRFLHDELFKASIDLSRYLRPFEMAPGMVELTEFPPADFLASPEAGILAGGILERGSFRYP